MADTWAVFEVDYQARRMVAHQVWHLSLISGQASEVRLMRLVAEDFGSDTLADLERARVIAVTLEQELAESRRREVRLMLNAQQVMTLLQEHGKGIVGHLLDDDDNAGERLRLAIAESKAAGRLLAACDGIPE